MEFTAVWTPVTKQYWHRLAVRSMLLGVRYWEQIAAFIDIAISASPVMIYFP